MALVHRNLCVSRELDDKICNLATTMKVGSNGLLVTLIEYALKNYPKDALKQKLAKDERNTV